MRHPVAEVTWEQIQRERQTGTNMRLIKKGKCVPLGFGGQVFDYNLFTTRIGLIFSCRPYAAAALGTAIFLLLLPSFSPIDSLALGPLGPRPTAPCPPGPKPSGSLAPVPAA